VRAAISPTTSAGSFARAASIATTALAARVSEYRRWRRAMSPETRRAVAPQICADPRSAASRPSRSSRSSAASVAAARRYVAIAVAIGILGAIGALLMRRPAAAPRAASA
jgi:hypothetical protein